MISKSSDPDPRQNAYRYALQLLSARDYSVRGVRGKLAGRGFCESDLEAVILRLTEEGWLNDRRYAERFAESAVTSGRYFGTRLKMEMRRRGFDEALVSEILETLLNVHDEEAEVKSLLGRRFPDFDFKQATERNKRRVAGFLQRRGYGMATIMKMLRNSE